MCYTCGCKQPYNDMGSDDNITEAHFQRAGGGAEGSAQAKRNMIELLQIELERDELAEPAQQY